VSVGMAPHGVVDFRGKHLETHGPGCSHWSGGYIACPTGIVRRNVSGAMTTLVRTKNDPSGHVQIGWSFLEPSPNGKTLLVEEDFYACGMIRQPSFLPVGGGQLQDAF